MSMIKLVEKYGGHAGIAFTVLVVGLLAYLHLSDSETVPKAYDWGQPKALYVCEAPEWVVEAVDEAVQFVSPWAKYSTVVKHSGPCWTVKEVVPVCDFPMGDGLRRAACVEGGVVLTLSDQGLDESSADEVLRASVNGEALKATAVFPSLLEPGTTEADKVKIVAHALLHAEGYGHVYTPLGAFTAEPTGHIMSRSVKSIGYATEGL